MSTRPRGLLAPSKTPSTASAAERMGFFRRSLLRVRFGEGPDGDVDLRRRRLPAEVIVDRVDGLAADLIGMLDRVAVHRPGLDRRLGFGRRVVADDGDLSTQARGLNGLRCTQRRVVVDSED